MIEGTFSDVMAHITIFDDKCAVTDLFACTVVFTVSSGSFDVCYHVVPYMIWHRDDCLSNMTLLKGGWQQ